MSHAVPALVTRRLELRPATLADAPAIQACFPHWDVVRYLSAAVPWPYPDDGALAFLRDKAIPDMDVGISRTWTIRPKSDPGRLFGAIGLYDESNNNRGFWLIPEARGQGFASEASEAVTRFWFDVLGRPSMRIPKAVANAASRRISERQGMRVIAAEERDYVSGRLPTEIWELTAHECRARQG